MSSWTSAEAPHSGPPHRQRRGRPGEQAKGAGIIYISHRLEEIKRDLIEKILNNDIEPLLSQYKVKEIEGGLYLKNAVDVVNNNAHAIENETYLIKSDSNFISPNNNIYIDKTAKIQQFVSLQAEDGPIVIDKGALVRSFSIIDGPSYIGKSSLIDSAKVRGGSTIKDSCKIGGEVEHAIFESFSNKHHEGFVGHSYIGSWVNIGAMATTSDLKNNYGNVRVMIDGQTVDTGTNKFGSIVCDYSKIGIGMMLSTGTVIEEGCNLFLEDTKLPKALPPFSWGAASKYEISRFIEDLKKMMERRNIKLSESREKFLRAIYSAN